MIFMGRQVVVGSGEFCGATIYWGAKSRQIDVLMLRCARSGITPTFDFDIDCHRAFAHSRFGIGICAKKQVMPNSFYCLPISKYY
jgi:hypothetical protein